jgi:uncharacterized protein (UPF0276 family)
MQNLPKLGVGVGFREQFRADLFLHRAEIDFLEITADHYLDATPPKIEELELLRQHFPLVPHGLDLSLGSAEGVDAKYLEKFAALIEKLQPAWFSEHICFTKSGGVDIGHLAPLAFTRESLEVLKRNIRRVREFIKTPLILENITYMVRFPFSEMDEAEFIAELVEETDCGLLLDVTNLYINSVNHDYDWREFLEKLPASRIVQLHFVGSHRHGNLLIDGHAHKTEAEIWNVFREVCVKSNVKGAILERDENFPPFAEILEEIRTAKEILQVEMENAIGLLCAEQKTKKFE